MPSAHGRRRCGRRDHSRVDALHVLTAPYLPARGSVIVLAVPKLMFSVVVVEERHVSLYGRVVIHRIVQRNGRHDEVARTVLERQTVDHRAVSKRVLFLVGQRKVFAHGSNVVGVQLFEMLGVAGNELLRNAPTFREPMKRGRSLGSFKNLPMLSSRPGETLSATVYIGIPYYTKETVLTSP